MRWTDRLCTFLSFVAVSLPKVPLLVQESLPALVEDCVALHTVDSKAVRPCDLKGPVEEAKWLSFPLHLRVALRFSLSFFPPCSSFVLVALSLSLCFSCWFASTRLNNPLPAVRSHALGVSVVVPGAGPSNNMFDDFAGGTSWENATRELAFGQV